MRLALLLLASLTTALPAAVPAFLGTSPIRFEPNQGQTDPNVLFFARDTGFRVALRRTNADFVLTDANGQPRSIRMKLSGAAAPEGVVGEQPLPGRSNYILGADPKAWIKDVAHYAKVRYRAVYPGIDMIYYSRDARLEYDFVVSPGADPRRIRLEYEGTQPSIDATGDLILRLAGGSVLQRKPVAYQTVNGVRREVEARYALKGNQVTLRLGAYDRSRDLVIDPVISYSSFLGGSAGERGSAIAVDAQGNAYITGTTASANFSRPGAYSTTLQGGNDVFVTKVNAAGSAILYSTFIGGTQTTSGFGHDHGRAILVDGSGNAIVAGFTDSSNFPVISGGAQTTYGGGFGDGFVLKLNASGTALLSSTYIGGSDTDEIQGLAKDGNGNLYVAGITRSSNLPVTAAYQGSLKGSVDGFVAKLNPTATARLYSTYLGGSQDDASHDITVDSAGNAYITGETNSSDFPVLGAYRSTKADGGDAYLTKLLPQGTLAFSTFLGGSGRDQGFGIAIDNAGSIYVAGETGSNDFPVNSTGFQRTMGGFSDAFVTKFNSSGNQLLYSTYLGGSLTDGAFAIAVDGSGRAHITGRTWSSNFPLKDAFQTAYGGAFSDGFVAKLSSEGGSLIYSSYLGGKNEDNPDAGVAFAGVGGVALDGEGNAYYTGRTDSEDFPTTMGSFQPTFGGRSFSIGDDNAFDAFVIKIGATGGTSGGHTGGGEGGGLSLNPSAMAAGSAATLVAVNGANFSTQSVVRVSGQIRLTHYVSSTQLLFMATQSDLATAANLLITVFDPVSGVSPGSAILVVTGPLGQIPDPPSSPNPADRASDVGLSAVLSWTGSSTATAYDVFFGTSPTPPLVATVNGTSYAPGGLRGTTTYYWRVSAKNSTANISSATWQFTTAGTGAAPFGYRFVPITPCRIVDTRAGQGTSGAFGPPALAAGAAREIPVPVGGCGIPASARAYSINVTVAPLEPLGFLSMWPAGQPQPLVSTLNSPHGGVVANAAIVPAGTNGSITVLATNRTELILDINGYFDLFGQNSFYAVNPCRLVDTRNGSGFAGSFGAPFLAAGSTREFPLLAGGCGIGNAAAYSLNVTAAPNEPLAYLTAWPSGSARPMVSTLNAMDGSVTANAAIVPAGSSGAIQTFATNSTNLILDVNGYFGPAGYQGEMLFQPVPPCRIADTRAAGNGAPVVGPGQKRDFQVSGKCGIPGGAKAYSVNVTVVPTAQLSYLTLWPSGRPRPLVSTLNSYLGRIVANAALVPAGDSGFVSVFVTDESHVILDVNGYFQ